MLEGVGTLIGVLGGATLADIIAIALVIILIILAIVVIVRVLVCLFDSRCRRGILCTLKAIIWFFVCAAIQANDAHPEKRPQCLAFCLAKLRDWLARCKDGASEKMP